MQIAGQLGRQVDLLFCLFAKLCFLRDVGHAGQNVCPGMLVTAGRAIENFTKSNPLGRKLKPRFCEDGQIKAAVKSTEG